jgi:hypothetical protein
MFKFLFQIRGYKASCVTSVRGYVYGKREKQRTSYEGPTTLFMPLINKETSKYKTNETNPYKR